MNVKQRIGIFGGTFNPPHTGHISAARQFYDELSLDMMFIMPSCIPVHKQISAVDDPLHRYAMCALAFLQDCEKRRYILSDLEISRSGKSYTVDTVKHFLEQFPKSELFLYVGTDMFSCFESWKDFEYLFSVCTVACAKRGKNDGEQIEITAEKYRKNYGANIVILENEPIEISSSQIRDCLLLYKNEEKCKNYLTESVYEYIIKHSVYSGKKEELLSEKITDSETLFALEKYARENLSFKRFSHTLAVKDKACELAKQYLCEYGYGEEYLADIDAAAIFHDSTKELGKEEQTALFGFFCAEPIYSESVLHSRTAAYIARTQFLVNNRVFGAIYSHTSGKADMNIFEKIIYLADFIEETRTHASCIELREFYNKAFDECKTENKSIRIAINKTLAKSFEMTLAYLEKEGKAVHPDLYAARSFYEEEKNLLS